MLLKVFNAEKFIIVVPLTGPFDRYNTSTALSLFQVYIGREPAYSNLMTYLAALLDYFGLEGARGAVVRAFFCRARGPGFSPTSF